MMLIFYTYNVIMYDVSGISCAEITFMYYKAYHDAIFANSKHKMLNILFLVLFDNAVNCLDYTVSMTD